MAAPGFFPCVIERPLGCAHPESDHTTRAAARLGVELPARWFFD
jgi:hypothetical protein